MAFEMVFQAFPPPEGPLKFAPVPWDSQLYGFPFFQLRCEEAPPASVAAHLETWLATLPSDHPCLVFSKIPPDAAGLARALARDGFYPVETLFEFKLLLEKFNPVIPHRFAGKNLRLAGAADLSRLIQIARAAFTTDRYHLDPNLPPEKADERFTRWVEQGLRAGDQVFVYEEKRSGEILGFLHARSSSSAEIDLSLSAVDPGCRNTLAGVMMYQLVMAECQAQGLRTAVTRTSVNNLQMINLLVRFGFRFTGAATTMHWYRSPPATRISNKSAERLDERTR